MWIFKFGGLCFCLLRRFSGAVFATLSLFNVTLAPLIPEFDPGPFDLGD
jgi:hypothetical protein